MPKTMFASNATRVEDIINHMGGAPLVIKVLEGTQGVGVVLAETKQAAKSVLEAFYGLQVNLLVQEFIKEAGGADIRALVIGGEVVGAMKRQGAEGDFRSNLHRGGEATKVRLTRAMKSTAQGAARAMGLGIAGVDMIESDRGPLVLEVNSSPGLEGIETVTGIDIAGKIMEYMKKRRSMVKPPRDKIGA